MSYSAFTSPLRPHSPQHCHQTILTRTCTLARTHHIHLLSRPISSPTQLPHKPPQLLPHLLNKMSPPNTPTSLPSDTDPNTNRNTDTTTSPSPPLKIRQLRVTLSPSPSPPPQHTNLYPYPPLPAPRYPYITLFPPPPRTCLPRSDDAPIHYYTDDFEEEEQRWRERELLLGRGRDEERGLRGREYERRGDEEEECMRCEEGSCEDWMEWAGILLFNCLVVLAVVGAGLVCWILVTN